MPQPASEPEWWTIQDIATYLGIEESTVRSYRAQGRLPDPLRLVGRTPIWAPTAIIEWQKSRPGRGRRAST